MNHKIVIASLIGFVVIDVIFLIMIFINTPKDWYAVKVRGGFICMKNGKIDNEAINC